jgi:cytoskeleton protein RodZ
MTKVHSMSDAIRSAGTDQVHPIRGVATGPEAANTVVSAGSLLRAARETAGLHIAALAVSLKVPVKKLEALEADRFELLPDAVFVRALASSVCRTLKIDTAPILERLPQTGHPKLAYQGMDINTPFRGPGDGPGPSVWAQISRPAVLAGLVLLLGSLVLVFLPAVETGGDAVNPDVGTRAMSTQPSMSAAIEAVVGAVSASAHLPRPIVSPLSQSSTDSSPVSSLPASASMPDLAAPVVPASTALSAIPTGILVFNAQGPSWVEVTDSKKVVVLRRMLGAGELVSASGALPLTAVVGRADVTQVQIRGKAFDLTAVTKDNVARFEVK